MKKIIAVALSLCMLLSGVSAFAADSDWDSYQQYVISFAAAGAPNEEALDEFTATILSCGDMTSLLAGTGMGVIFEVMGALEYDAWLAAGKPAANTDGITPDEEAAGEAAETEKTEGAPAGENATVELVIGGVSVTLTVYEFDGVQYVKLDDLIALAESTAAPAEDAGAASEEALFEAYLDYERSMLQADGEGNDDFANTLDTVTIETYDETSMPFEMFTSMFGALTFDGFKAYYEENGEYPIAPESMAAPD